MALNKIPASMIADLSILDPTAETVQYVAPYTGAAAQAVAAHMGRFVSITDFGAVGDNSTDCADAIEDAIDALVAVGGGMLFVPAGKFVISRKIVRTITTAGVDLGIVGMCNENSILKWPNADGGFKFTLDNNKRTSGNCIFVQDVALITGQAGGGKAVDIDGGHTSGMTAPGPVFVNVVFRGANDLLYWDYGTFLKNCGQSYHVGCVWYGKTGDVDHGTAYCICGENDPTDHYVTNCRTFFGEYGLYVGAVGTFGDPGYAGCSVEGVTVKGCSFVACGTGIRWKPSTAGEPLLCASNNHIAAASKCILGKGAIQSFIHDNLLYQAYGSTDWAAVLLTDSFDVQLHHNTIYGSNYGVPSDARNGIVIGSGCSNSIIRDNIFRGYDGSYTLGTGVWLMSGSSGIRVNGVTQTLTAQPILDQGTNNSITTGDFRGALIYRDSDVDVAHNVQTIIGHNVVEYDTAGFFSNVNNGRFTIPNNVKRVRLRAQVTWLGPTAGNVNGYNHIEAQFRKNGSGTYQGRAREAEGLYLSSGNPSQITRAMCFESPVLSVVPGDYFEVYALQQNVDSAIRKVSGTNTGSSLTWFSIEVVE